MNSGNVIKSDKLELIMQEGDELFYLFKPSVFRLFPKSGSMRKMDIKNVVRFFWLYLSGYKIYISTTLDNVVKGSIVFSKGGSFRFPFSTKKDLIDGPTFTVPEFRGQGVMVRLADLAINVFEKDYEKIYGTVSKDNIASLKRCSKNGYKEVGFVSYNNFFHRGKLDPNGDMILVMYEGKEKLK